MHHLDAANIFYFSYQAAQIEIRSQIVARAAEHA